MKIPSKEELPLQAEKQLLSLDSDRTALFHKAFRSQGTEIPATVTAIMMKGVFDLVNKMQVDWKNLLHATQTYTYNKALTTPSQLHAQTKLVDCKFRAGMHWLNFETPIFQDGETEASIVSKSLIMVKEDS
jgi:hypothetical protein